MSTDELTAAIVVMQAAARGEAIQCRYRISTDDQNWRDTSDPSWDWARYIYRIKPTPREWWGWRSVAGSVHAILDEAQARAIVAEVNTRTLVRITEVLP